eukprot:TRINITY_DN1099_c0_g1_i1.p1 TRINITY_DN1099_c0_g1~~TRINITY_DN1099_c0_g1_i1.p1  ORF type:complete len:355 (+),score=74.27 TRINITY_DN1099_c0_g1_i1:59-1123(+)
MKRTILLLVLLSVAFSQTLVPIPKDYTSSFTFHYKGNIYAIFDVGYSNNTASPQLAMLSNNKWSKTLTLPYKCSDFPCGTNTNDMLLQKNLLYVDIGEPYNSQRILASINLDTFTISTTVQTPDKLRIDGARFIPLSDTSVVYLYYRQMFLQYWDAAKLTLPSLKWQDWDIDLPRQSIQLAVPFDANNIVICGYSCESINVNTNQITPIDSTTVCQFGNYIRASKTLFCSEWSWEANSTVISTNSVSLNTITTNLNATIGDYTEYPSFSSVDDKLGRAYLVTAVYSSDNQSYQYYLYIFNVNTLQQISKSQLNIGNYAINRASQAINSEGDGILALTMMPNEVGLADQLLLLSV